MIGVDGVSLFSCVDCFAVCLVLFLFYSSYLLLVGAFYGTVCRSLCAGMIGNFTAAPRGCVLVVYLVIVAISRASFCGYYLVY